MTYCLPMGIKDAGRVVYKLCRGICFTMANLVSPCGFEASLRGDVWVPCLQYP
jgi:hypothetical protein